MATTLCFHEICGMLIDIVKIDKDNVQVRVQSIKESLKRFTSVLQPERRSFVVEIGCRIQLWRCSDNREPESTFEIRFISAKHGYHHVSEVLGIDKEWLNSLISDNG
ncbi:hypothetical protein RF11_05446 [Thelohanellus kitauei]|uniref:Uncharacterized protein n=1 Tax=Thelohanellus kitauei TaxID=669202 RepID=A0A0C2N0J5_THEKT|nr:hypothetical protein RF11_05446 [Thelohanellus kitauei]